MKNRMEEAPFLIAPEGDLKGTRWPLVNSTFLIGRGEDCDIVLLDRQVSRHHARIKRTADGYVIEDLCSKNHTHLNGVRIESEIVLQDGDEIQVALAVKLNFIGSEATLPLSVDEAIRFGIGRLRMEVQAHRVWVNEQEIDMDALQDRLVQIGVDPETLEPIFATVNVTPALRAGSARNSSAFFSRFSNGGSHAGDLSEAELRLMSEWLDIGAQYYNDPFAVPQN